MKRVLLSAAGASLIFASAPRVDATQQPPAKPAPNPMATYLQAHHITVTQASNPSRPGDGAPPWIAAGSGAFKDAPGSRFVGVSLVPPQLAEGRWQDKLLACHTLAISEALKAYDTYWAFLMKTAGQEVPEERHHAEGWGSPAFTLSSFAKSWSEDSGGATHAGSTVTVKVTLPPAVLGGALLHLTEESIQHPGEAAPKDKYTWSAGGAPLDEARLTQALEYFAKAGFPLRGVHAVGDDLACVTAVSFEDARKHLDASLTAEQRKAVAKHEQQAFEELAQ